MSVLVFNKQYIIISVSFMMLCMNGTRFTKNSSLLTVGIQVHIGIVWKAYFLITMSPGIKVESQSWRCLATHSYVISKEKKACSIFHNDNKRYKEKKKEHERKCKPMQEIKTVIFIRSIWNSLLGQLTLMLIPL